MILINTTFAEYTNASSVIATSTVVQLALTDISCPTATVKPHKGEQIVWPKWTTREVLRCCINEQIQIKAVINACVCIYIYTYFLLEILAVCTLSELQHYSSYCHMQLPSSRKHTLLLSLLSLWIHWRAAHHQSCILYVLRYWVLGISHQQDYTLATDNLPQNSVTLYC